MFLSLMLIPFFHSQSLGDFILLRLGMLHRPSQKRVPQNHFPKIGAVAHGNNLSVAFRTRQNQRLKFRDAPPQTFHGFDGGGGRPLGEQIEGGALLFLRFGVPQCRGAQIVGLGHLREIDPGEERLQFRLRPAVVRRRS